MLIKESLLNLYAENGLNVLLEGRHGVGKTEIIKKIFNKNYGDNWVYFSAPTMDAWTDFIGVPKDVKRDDGTHVLELIKPARFADDTVEAIFFDEYNRAPDKVKDAVMELMQFKSINGKKFENLKVIWGAINPSDEGNYKVEENDPAQIDRYVIQIKLPYKLDIKYFKDKYPEIYSPFTTWWNGLPKDIKYMISPRRLDNSIFVHLIGGDLKHCLPKESNISELIRNIENHYSEKEWDNFILLKEEEKELFLSNLSNIDRFKSFILKDFNLAVPYMPDDFVIQKIQNERDLTWLKLAVIHKDKIKTNVKNQVISNLMKVMKKKGKNTEHITFIECLEILGRFKVENNGR